MKRNPILVFIIYLICTLEDVQAKDLFVSGETNSQAMVLDDWHFSGKGISNKEGKLTGSLVSVGYSVSSNTAMSFSFESQKGRSEISGVYFKFSSQF